MRNIAALSLATIGLVFSSQGLAQPANDRFANAEEIGPGAVVRIKGTTKNATEDILIDTFNIGEFEFVEQVLYSRSVWYKWTAPISGSVTLLSAPTDGSVEMETITTTGPTELTLINDTFSYYFRYSSYAFEVTAGETYYTSIMRNDDSLFQRPGTNQNFVLIQRFTQDDLSDQFATRTQVVGRSFILSGNNASFTQETGEPAHAATSVSIPAGKSAWMTWTSPTRATVTLTAESRVFEPLVAVYSGDELASLQRVATSTFSRGVGTSASLMRGTASFVAEANVPYHFAVDGSKSKAGAYTFTLTATTARPGFIVRPQPQTVQEGETAVFSSSIASTGEATYQWQILRPGSKIWANLTDDETHFNVTTNTLTVSSVSLAANKSQYRLQVTDLVGVSLSPGVLLTVTEFGSVATEVLGAVSLDISNTSLVDSTEGVTFYAKGLPRGLTLNANTGVISGQIAPSTKPGVYRISYGTIKDGKRGTSEYIVVIDVRPFAPTLLGAFEGLLQDASSIPVGKLSLRVSNQGAYTGSYFDLNQGRAYPLRGTLELNQTNRTAGTPAGAPLTIALGRGLPSYRLEFSLSEPTGADPAQFGSLAAYLTDDTLGLLAQAVDGKPVSRATSAAPALWAGSYTLVLGNGTLLGTGPSADIPLGAGHATGRISNLGVLSLRGLLPDNTPFTAALASSTDASYLVAQRHRAVGGSLAGAINLETQVSSDLLSTEYHSASTSGSSLFWVKPESRRDALYPNGFGTSPVRFTTLMEPWTNPAGQFPASLGLSTNGDLKISIVAATPQDSNDALTNEGNNYGLPIDVRLSTAGKLSFVRPAENASKFTLAINSSTGAYTGSYQLAEPIVPPATKSAKIRTVKFSGVFLQLSSTFLGDLVGAGFAIVPPFDTTEKATSALLEFRAGPQDSPFIETSDR